MISRRAMLVALAATPMAAPVLAAEAPLLSSRARLMRGQALALEAFNSGPSYSETLAELEREFASLPEHIAIPTEAYRDLLAAAVDDLSGELSVSAQMDEHDLFTEG